nr:hypothetical protein [Methylobacterium sp. L1A1]
MVWDWAWIAEKAPTAISVGKDLILAGAAISTAVVGWRALGKWRDETLGKRRLELAEDVLATFYQVQEVIHDARGRFVDAREMVREEGVLDEVARSVAYAPRRRLRASFDKIVDLRTKRHRFAAVFGQEATKPWDDIEAVLREIDGACDTLLDLRGEHVPRSDPSAAFYAEQRRILGRGGPDDPIAPRVAQAVADVEAICRPMVRASLTRRKA